MDTDRSASQPAQMVGAGLVAVVTGVVLVYLGMGEGGGLFVALVGCALALVGVVSTIGGAINHFSHFAKRTSG